MPLLAPTDHEGRSAWDWAGFIYDKLCNIEEALIPDTRPPVARMRVPFVIQTDGSGNGSVSLDLRPGGAWNLLSYAYQTAGTTGYVAFYRDVEEGTSLLEVSAATNIESNTFSPDGHYVPEQSKLLVVARGVPANTVVAGNVAAKSVSNAKPHTTTRSSDL